MVYKNPEIFNLNEYYLWRKNPFNHTERQLPWNREYLNIEFLSYERKRIKEVFEWRVNLTKLKNNDKVSEIMVYTIPLNISSNWISAIAKLGNFKHIGLSALQNSPEAPTIAIFPRESKLPDDFKLIRIITGKKISLMNEKDMIGEHAVLVEDWELINSDTIYVDLPHEQRFLQEMFQRNLGGEKSIALSFQSPILSSPYTHSFGGISLASLSGNSLFASELIKTIKMMVPPEYRGGSPPEKAFLGANYSHSEGIKFLFAERPYSESNKLAAIQGYDYSQLSGELHKRAKFCGEYSIFSTFSYKNQQSSEIWQELIKNFGSTEITLPQDLDSFEYDEIDLTRLRKEINEDLWLQVVNSRQHNPQFGNGEDQMLHSTLSRVKEDFDVLLSEVNKEETHRNIMVNSMLSETTYNLRRLAQSFARARNSNNLINEDFLTARGLIIDNFTGFISSDKFSKIVSKVQKSSSDLRFKVVQTILINNPNSTVNQIYEDIKSTNLFKDLYDLQGLLTWMKEKGQIWSSREGLYSWL